MYLEYNNLGLIAVVVFGRKVLIKVPQWEKKIVLFQQDLIPQMW